MAKLQWTPDLVERGPRCEFRAGDYVITTDSRLVAPRQFGEFFVVTHKDKPIGETPLLLAAKRIAQRHSETNTA